MKLVYLVVIIDVVVSLSSFVSSHDPANRSVAKLPPNLSSPMQHRTQDKSDTIHQNLGTGERDEEGRTFLLRLVDRLPVLILAMNTKSTYNLWASFASQYAAITNSFPPYCGCIEYADTNLELGLAFDLCDNFNLMLQLSEWDQRVSSVQEVEV